MIIKWNERKRKKVGNNSNVMVTEMNIVYLKSKQRTENEERKKNTQNHIATQRSSTLTLFFHVLLQLRPFHWTSMYPYLNGEYLSSKKPLGSLSFFGFIFFTSRFWLFCWGLHSFAMLCAEKKAYQQIVPRLLCNLEIFSPKITTRTYTTCVKLMKEFKCTDMFRVVKRKA